MKKVLIFCLLPFSIISCSKLDEKLGSQTSTSAGGGTISTASLLTNAYDAMKGPYQNQDGVWCTQEHTTDEAIGPTRAGDWDDNGIWRTLHGHQWDANHAFLANTFRDLGRVNFATTDLLRFSPTPVQAAEARLLRAMATYTVADGWNQVPFRENTTDVTILPKVRKGVEAIDYVITELNAALPDLPVGPANRANKDAARFLLMRCYLNKGIYANRVTPTFATADMNQVISLADQIMNSTRNYSLATNYFDNFAKNNDAIGTENIWTAENIGGSNSGNVRSRWHMTLHYNQNPGGWNGFTTLSDFYDKFEAVDKRRGGNAYPGMTNGILPGFLIGQQFTGAGVPLKDTKGNPLVFTREVKAIEANPSTLEVTGIRVIKYPIDYTSAGDNKDNDYIYARISDVLLMKAEAILRGGTATANPASFGSANTALGIVNYLRTSPSRSATVLTTLSLDNILDERGREFYWEGMRRTDLIRFGKYLNAWQEKSASSSERLIFPLPSRELAANPNLTQNPGY
jgi:starch-binding outer membrane protein, SusD/RagB family